mmetsp:Transcript_21418/g.46527  ORF Transcript_21418/g.46527 Transcript_21418/m.46527 type:complete len:280 (+) Transcript_21418:1721-2560(+)
MTPLQWLGRGSFPAGLGLGLVLGLPLGLGLLLGVAVSAASVGGGPKDTFDSPRCNALEEADLAVVVLEPRGVPPPPAALPLPLPLPPLLPRREALLEVRFGCGCDERFRATGASAPPVDEGVSEAVPAVCSATSASPSGSSFFEDGALVAVAVDVRELVAVGGAAVVGVEGVEDGGAGVSSSSLKFDPKFSPNTLRQEACQSPLSSSSSVLNSKRLDSCLRVRAKPLSNTSNEATSFNWIFPRGAFLSSESSCFSQYRKCSFRSAKYRLDVVPLRVRVR